jgi:prephenate dehydrogenase
MNIGFIGFGLIGGSIAKKLKKLHPDYTITVTSRSKTPLYQAKDEGVVDVVAQSVDESFCDCDYIFLCTPVVTITEYLATLRHIIKDSCIITDVGSVKSCIHEAVHAAKLDAHFIGGHPMAGSEHSGYAYSSETLLRGAVYVVTPTESSPEKKVAEMCDIIKELEAIPVIMDCKKHDYAVAGISHVPHLASAALAMMVRENDDDENHMHTLAAGGFKDTTRIAASSPEMWEQICISNRDAIGVLLDKYIDELETVRSHIKNDSDDECSEYIKELFNTAGGYRNTFK